jgi:CMP/dCMP kinase
MGAFIIAVDGPAAAGKGTLSRRLAAKYKLAHLDTGALYRATARDVLAAGADPADGEAAAEIAAKLDAATLDDPALRS